MSSILIIQSNCLIAVSICASMLAFWFDYNTNIVFFMLAMGLIVLFGVPHGALDVLFARQTYGLTNYTSWLKFLVAYVAAAIAIVLTWVIIPNVFFIIFLMLSLIHFSDDLNIRGINLTKMTYAASIIVMPSLFYSAELINFYSMIIDFHVAKSLVHLCQFLIYPIALMLIIQFLSKKIELRTKIEIFSVVLIMSVITPVVAFALYFCFMHSARHVIRSVFFLNEFTKRTFLIALIVPTISVIIIGTIIGMITFTQSIETDLIRIIFIGLAALTVPHAWLLKRSKFLKADIE